MIKDSLSRVKFLFNKRRMAYCQTFNKTSPLAILVLEDLSKFCRAHETTFTKDDRASLMLEGRREVWLRIQSYLNLTSEELYSLHHVKSKGE